MRTYFRSLSDVLGSPLAQTAQTFSPRHAGGHRVLKSTKLEDAAYRDLRRGDNELDALEKACGEKLSTFPALSRDIYQSFYSLNVRRQPENAISPICRRLSGRKTRRSAAQPPNARGAMATTGQAPASN